jgi:YjbE family integral membrane protein
LFHDAEGWLIPLLQVLLIDITMAGDNAVVIGVAASRVPKSIRRKVIFRGMAVAVILRVILASFAMSLLHLLGLSLAGGFLLLWVSWRIWRDIERARGEPVGHEPHHKSRIATAMPEPGARRGIPRAVMQIVIADASMSLDNVLAVAGAAQGHYWVLVLGLLLSIALMGMAVSLVARLLRRYPWISYAGLFVVIYVSATMIWNGSNEVLKAIF